MISPFHSIPLLANHGSLSYRRSHFFHFYACVIYIPRKTMIRTQRYHWISYDKICNFMKSRQDGGGGGPWQAVSGLLFTAEVRVDSRPVHVGCMEGKVTLWLVCLRVNRNSSLSITPLSHHIASFICPGTILILCSLTCITLAYFHTHIRRLHIYIYYAFLRSKI